VGLHEFPRSFGLDAWATERNLNWLIGTMKIRSTRGCDNVVLHVMNRAIQGVTLFNASDAYAVFVCTLEQATHKVPVRILSYCVMPNHWHLLLWPPNGDQLSRFMQWLTATHAKRWRGSQATTGKGAVYQGRFQAVPVHDEPSFYRVARYVERNPVRAKLVERTDDWGWSSASRSKRDRVELCQWPVSRPPNWQHYINDEEPPADLDEIRTCVAYNRPIGPDTVTLAGSAHAGRSEGRRSATRTRTARR
jgi:putative transposase